MNVNTKQYWDRRFGSGDWEEKDGRSQTRGFAESQLPHFQIPATFEGTICDFGCGAGDAFPVYRKAWPKAHLIGVDFSGAAIALCRKRYGEIGEFISGDTSAIPCVNIIITSNTFEHIENDKAAAVALLNKCERLYIIVPFREEISRNGISEHINSYELDSFDFIGRVKKTVFASAGWGVSGWRALYEIYLKNLVRPLLGRPLARRQYQIMYLIQN